MDRLTRMVHSVSRRMCLIGVLVISAMMVLTCADVVLRYFRHPIKGTYDIIGILGGVLIALPLSYSHVMGRQVAVESIFSGTRQTVQTIVKTITGLLSLGMVGLIAWRCFFLGNDLWRTGRVSDTIGIPIFPFLYVLTFGCGVYFLVLVIDFFKLFKKTDTR
jgi:TRAP-type C4-dicarboxylate transport system permease small subunit